MLAMLLVSTAAPALAQPTEAKINEDVFSASEKGKAIAKAGGTEAIASCDADPKGVVEAGSGDIYAKAPCKPEAAPPPPPPTAVFINIDPVIEGGIKGLSCRGAVSALLSATSTNTLVSCDGVNVYDGCCK